MSQILHLKQDGPQTYSVSIVGVLDGMEDLPSLQDLPSDADVHFDLHSLRALNSLGIQDFMTWCKSFPFKDMTFSHCPVAFVHQLNLIPHFLPPTARVKSFYVPYFNEDDDEDVQILYQKGLHFFRNANGEIELHHPVIFGSSKTPSEIDVSVEQYFRFLKHYC